LKRKIKSLKIELANHSVHLILSYHHVLETIIKEEIFQHGNKENSRNKEKQMNKENENPELNFKKCNL